MMSEVTTEEEFNSSASDTDNETSYPMTSLDTREACYTAIKDT